jgi:hypothetical protein
MRVQRGVILPKMFACFKKLKASQICRFGLAIPRVQLKVRVSYAVC